MKLSHIRRKVPLAHFFLPHPHTHNRAHLLSPIALLIYIAFFIALQFSFNVINKVQPGVLGISSDVKVEELIKLTNEERKKKGLNELQPNEMLSKAAQLKGENMFEENYWAHFAPSGKSPWDFITGSGYKYMYAGENLAKNFYKSEDVVKAWMNSPTHRDNLLSDKYGDIGMAVLEGNLNGSRTVLVVQEFGATPEYVASKRLLEGDKPTVASLPKEINTAAVPDVASSVIKYQPDLPVVAVDSFKLYKTAGLTILVFVATLIAVDLIVIKRRGVFQLAHRHVPHMALLGIAASSLINSTPGTII